MNSPDYEAVVDRLIYDIAALTGRPVKELRVRYNLPVLPDPEPDSLDPRRRTRAAA
ncbi:MAG: hypothetical protein GX427_01200 [Actinomycetales bacterium]|nr:hypothetical protein [Actinomycetales bacterium]